MIVGNGARNRSVCCDFGTVQGGPEKVRWSMTADVVGAIHSIFDGSLPLTRQRFHRKIPLIVMRRLGLGGEATGEKSVGGCGDEDARRTMVRVGARAGQTPRQSKPSIVIAVGSDGCQYDAERCDRLMGARVLRATPMAGSAPSRLDGATVNHLQIHV